MPDVDTVVIGSGAGGMAAALGLARAGQRVLVLEQHYLPGGWCHSFPLEGYQFSPGVHYLGELGRGGSFRAMLEGLGVANDLPMVELNPDAYDHVHIGGERFDIPAGRAAYRHRLMERFPRDARNVDRYLGLMVDLSEQLLRLADIRGPSDAIKTLASSSALATKGWRSLQSVLDGYFSDPMIKAVLSIQAGDHGVAPRRVPCVQHALIASHYMNGAHYPLGGARSIPKAFIRQLKAHGGDIRMKTRVQRILVETGAGGRTVVGVQLEGGETISCKQVVSNADPGITFGSLIEPQHLSKKLKRRLKGSRYSISCLSLFLAVDINPRSLGMDSGNEWYCRSTDINAAYQLGADPASIAEHGVDALFLTCPTLKDPTKVKRGHHTLEAFCFVDHEAFSRWAGTDPEARPDDYQQLKRRLMAAMIDAVERMHPGLREHIVFSELGTPITNQHYVQSTTGSLYGVEKTLANLGPMGFDVHTELDGLFLCGASTLAHGVMGAMASGVAAAAAVLDARSSSFMNSQGQTLRTVSAEDTSGWPADLKAKLP